MGMYDTVIVPCPKCGTKSEFQSESGKCILATYELEEAPADVLYDINRHGPNTCTSCGTKYGVTFEVKPAKVKKVASIEWKEPEEEDD